MSRALAGLLLGLLRLAAGLLGWLDRRAAVSAAVRAEAGRIALKIVQMAGTARRIEEQVAGMDERTVREELSRHGDFRD